jgi:hypothetical protein
MSTVSVKQAFPFNESPFYSRSELCVWPFEQQGTQRSQKRFLDLKQFQYTVFKVWKIKAWAFLPSSHGDSPPFPHQKQVCPEERILPGTGVPQPSEAPPRSLPSYAALDR